jgi:hypothetical protein
MTQSEAQTAAMPIFDIEDVRDMREIPMDEPTFEADPTLDTTEGEELLLGVSQYS